MAKAFDEFITTVGPNAKLEMWCDDAHEAGNFLVASGLHRITVDGNVVADGK